MYDETTNTDSVFGTQSEFENKYGSTTKDGTPRFGDDYAFLHHPSELTKTDRVKVAANGFFDSLCDDILSIFK